MGVDQGVAPDDQALKFIATCLKFRLGDLGEVCRGIVNENLQLLRTAPEVIGTPRLYALTKPFCINSTIQMIVHS